MKKVKDWIRSISRKKLWIKLFAYFLLISMLPLLFLSLFTAHNAEKNIMEVARRSAVSAMDIISYNIERQFQKYNYLSYFITKDKQLQDLAQMSGAEELLRDEKLIERYRTLLKGYYNSVTDAEYVGVAMENGIVLNTKNPVPESHDLTRTDWYVKCISNPNAEHLILFKAGKGLLRSVLTPRDVIMACRAICDEDGRVVGVSMVVLSTNVLAQSATNVLDRRGSFLYIMNEESELIYSPYVNEIPCVDDEKMYVRLQRDLPSLGWSMVGMMRVGDAIESVRQVQTLGKLLFLIMLIAVAVASALASKGILKPIYTLKRTMKQAEQGDLNALYAFTGNDEINELGLHFNSMMETTRTLLEQVRGEQRAKRKAEMSALLANIKPHFLYNTLDTICWMASQYNADDITETVEALSTLFRVTLSKGSEIISLTDEVAHVRSYLQIQKLRYEEKLSYTIDVDDACQGYMVQKLIVQPLVENAIYHGIKESGRNGTVSVRVKKTEDALLLIVADDGLGMSAQRLSNIRESLQNGTRDETQGYGMLNVRDRLFLSYGRDFGLCIESEYGEGTVCVIRHPLIKECENVSDADS